MSRFTIVAPRGPLRDAVMLCLEPVPRSIDLWFRELKPDKTKKYPAEIISNTEGWIYGIQHDASATREDIDWLVGRLQTKWPYVRAEPEPPLWFTPTVSHVFDIQPTS